MRKRLLSIILILTVLLVFQAVPVFAEGSSEDLPQTVCAADILIDASSGQILYAKNADAKLRPASMTKMMTCLLALEYYKDLGTEVTVTKAATGIDGNSLELKEGEVLTARQLLYGLMLHSSNDAACCLAIDVGGSIEKFSALMNERAAAIGAKSTHFINPNGLTDSMTHITTASDMAKIARECMKNDEFRKIVKTKTYTIPATNKSKERKVVTTDQLLVGKNFKVKVNGTERNALYENAVGIKTGLMPGAMYCFCGAADNGSMKLIAVAMRGAQDQDRFADVISMFDYGFANFHSVELYKAGASAGHVWIRGGNITYAGTEIKEGAYAALTENESDDLASAEIDLDKGLKAPLKKGTKVGSVTVYKDGEKIGESDVVLARDISSGGPWSKIYISNRAFISAISVIILLILFNILVVRRRRARKAAIAARRKREREKKAMEIAMERRRERERYDDRDWPF